MRRELHIVHIGLCAGILNSGVVFGGFWVINNSQEVRPDLAVSRGIRFCGANAGVHRKIGDGGS